jgi:hypothetical protein
VVGKDQIYIKYKPLTLTTQNSTENKEESYRYQSY